jgi:replicative DNA helicase
MDADVLIPLGEPALLTACLRYGANAFYAASEHVRREDFASPAHRAVWAAIGRVADSGGRPEVHVVWDALGEDRGIVEASGGRALLATLAGGEAVRENLALYAKEVHSKAQQREAGRIMREAMAEIERGVFDLADLQEDLFRLEDTPHDSTTFQAAMEQVFDDSMREVGNVIEFPWAELNWLTHGMRPGQYFIVAAETSGGKTAFALETTAHAIKHDASVLYVTLEMPPVQLGLRLAQMRGYDTSAHYVGGGKADTKAVLELQNEFAATAKASHITMVDRVAQLPALIRRYKPGLLVIDHIGLLAGKGNSVYEQVSANSRDLKLLSLRYDLPLLVLCQLNRDTGRAPLDRLRDSGKLAQDADTVIFVHRDHDADHNFQNTGKFQVAKNRSGMQGAFDVTFNGQMQRFFAVDKRFEQ